MSHSIMDKSHQIEWWATKK